MIILRKRFLCQIFENSSQNRKGDPSFRLLGYPLSLSPKERKILSLILQEEPLSGAELCQRLSLSVSRAALSVYICAINKKAAAISGRRLIVFTDGAYRLSSTM